MLVGCGWFGVAFFFPLQLLWQSLVLLPMSAFEVRILACFRMAASSAVVRMVRPCFRVRPAQPLEPKEGFHLHK